MENLPKLLEFSMIMTILIVFKNLIKQILETSVKLER